jgi:Domain of unknown function (DUF6456)
MARPRKSGKRTKSGRLSRAARRISERTVRNALARGVAAEIAAEPPRRVARTKSQLELLEGRKSITPEHRRAGERLERDYRQSQTNPARLIGRYEANMPKAPKRYQAAADTPQSLIGRERFERAMAAAGPLSGILLHVCICDEPATAWAPMNGRAASHGVPVLLVAWTRSAITTTRGGAMNVWTIPEVRQAVRHILHAARLVQLEQPDLPPRRRLQEARRYCPGEILQATRAIIRAEEMAQNGPYRRGVVERRRKA